MIKSDHLPDSEYNNKGTLIICQIWFIPIRSPPAVRASRPYGSKSNPWSQPALTGISPVDGVATHKKTHSVGSKIPKNFNVLLDYSRPKADWTS